MLCPPYLTAPLYEDLGVLHAAARGVTYHMPPITGWRPALDGGFGD